VAGIRAEVLLDCKQERVGGRDPREDAKSGWFKWFKWRWKDQDAEDATTLSCLCM
jgi:hypothetical protein